MHSSQTFNVQPIVDYVKIRSNALLLFLGKTIFKDHFPVSGESESETSPMFYGSVNSSVLFM